MINSKIIIDNLVINYCKNESDSKNLILFLHWRWRSLNDWRWYFEKLEKKWTNFIALDLPGFGSSNRPQSSRWVQDYSEFVIKLLEKIWNTKKIILVWHSFGWRIGFYLWANYPNILKKLVLIAPGWVEKIISWPIKLIIKISKFIFSIPWLHIIWNKLKNTIWSTDYKNSWNMKDIFVKVVNQDLSPVLSQIKISSIIYWWEQDDQISWWQIDKIINLIPNAQLKKYPNIWHDLHLEKIDDILSHLD